MGPLTKATRSRAAVSLAVAATLAATLAAVLAGCGLGAGNTPSGVQLTVTSDFGARLVHAWSAPQMSGEETVMSLLMRNARVGTSDGGGFVESIDGRSSEQSEGEPVGWFYFVNGVLAPKGAAETAVHSGDRIWWDLHDWSQSEEVPAVVGSFPAPFTTGLDGRRLPVRVECAALASAACTEVSERLRALGVQATVAALGPVPSSRTLCVLVGAWTAIGHAPPVRTIEQGPRASGVYARFSPSGETLTLLDERGRKARTLAAGAGLVAATGSGAAPVWVVTGTDEAGVLSAAGAFAASELRDHFALALAPGGARLPAPLPGGAAA